MSKVCDTCGKEIVGFANHVGGDGSWGASYMVCHECFKRYKELKNEERDKKLREAVRAERLERERVRGEMMDEEKNNKCSHDWYPVDVNRKGKPQIIVDEAEEWDENRSVYPVKQIGVTRITFVCKKCYAIKEIEKEGDN